MNKFTNIELNSLLSEEKWLLCQESYLVEKNPIFETNFTLTNGYMGTRGSFEEGPKNEYPGSFIAGVFNQSEDETGALVNMPNWLGLKIYVDGLQLNPDECEMLDFERILDMKKGILLRRTIYRIDGTVTNTEENPRLRVKHLKLIENSNLKNKGCYLETATRDKEIHIGMASCLRTYNKPDGQNEIKYRRISDFGEQSVEYVEIDIFQNKTVVVDKYVVAFTTRDVIKKDLKAVVEPELDCFASEGLSKELERHVMVYGSLWNTADIGIDGDERADKDLRFNIFHLMSSVNESDSRVNIGAKGLHGEGYRGHTFWDTEIYMLPFFMYTRPHAARALLLYRYGQLDDARRNAAIDGHEGARYPWEAADDGTEACVKWATDIVGNFIRCWCGEIEIHITADVAYGVYKYYKITDDIDFILDYGCEIIIETAKYWTSKCKYNRELDRYEIKDVIGPDEFHTHVNNNFYTNYMAKWNIRKALELVRMLKNDYPARYGEIAVKTCLTTHMMDRMQEVESKIYIPFDGEKKLAEQFEGYFKKKDYVISGYDENDMPLWPEDCNTSNLEETQLIKQPDVVMLMLLLAEDFDRETRWVNYEYYKKRTTHKSTLSASSCALMGLSLGDAEEAYRCFIRTSEADLVDAQGNTRQGMHMASAGGTWQVATYGFAGMHVDKDGILCFDPKLPENWRKLSFKVLWRGDMLKIEIKHNSMAIKLSEGKSQQVRVKVKDTAITLNNGKCEVIAV